ncbi:response regulator [Geomonas sp. Red69]|uniref:response regulator n=1 Tax=Geomonas diazotrophica TaxID=2843197 RepID=UPI001C124C89|nr:response regulator [Geomonas diazotrophica]MBU5637665.1 response regulator [Geomonas diazotrophica]
MGWWQINNLSLRRRFFLLSFSIILVFSVAVAATLFAAQKNKLERSLENKGRGLARYVSSVCTDALILKDTLQLDALVAEVHDDEIIYTVIEDERGNALTTAVASLNSSRAKLKPYLDKLPPDAPIGTIIAALKKDLDVVELSQTIMVDSSVQGAVRIGLSKHNIHAQLLRQTAIILVGMLFMSLTLAITLNVAANRLVLRPVSELARVADQLTAGNMAARVTSSSVGEIETVCRSFNLMAQRLEGDIAELKRAEASVRLAQESQEAILNSMPDLMFRTDRDGVIKEFHSSAMNLLYLPPEQFMGRSIPDILPEEPARIIMAALAEAEKNGSHRGAVYSLALPQGEMWFELSVTAMGTPCTGFIMLARDVTERRRMVEEQQQLEKQLLHSQKLESLGVLAGGIAHDFNNILMAIMGNAELALMRTNKESPAIGNLRSIEQASARAADLAAQMLAYSGKGKFIIEHLDLNRLLQEMLHMLEVSISKKAVLQFDLAESLPHIEADTTQIRQVIMNLVINASEAIGERNGTISVKTGSIECDRSYLRNVWQNEELPEGLYVYFEITDTGCGMDDDTLAKLFDPFFTTKFTGRGLGMAAVLGIVRGHKGAIVVYSEPDLGTTIKVLIPASDQRAEPARPQPRASVQWQGAGNVLLVDDEETVRNIGSEMLKELGFSPITASDGKEALEAYQATPGIGVVILDLTMPNMDGDQCLNELKKLAPGVKVVMSSGFSEVELKQKFLGKEVAGFIQKPYKLSELREILRNVSPGT